MFFPPNFAKLIHLKKGLHWKVLFQIYTSGVTIFIKSSKVETCCIPSYFRTHIFLHMIYGRVRLLFVNTGETIEEDVAMWKRVEHIFV